MKRTALLAMCFILGLNSAAHAADNSADNHYDSVEEAYAAIIAAGTGLAAQAEDALRGEDPDLAAALAGFAAIAAEARDAMDALDGPADLRCIYNGMAADAGKRAQELAAAEDADTRAAVLEDIAFLGEDAVLVTPEVAADNDVLAGLPPMTCEAADEPVDAGAIAALFAS